MSVALGKSSRLAPEWRELRRIARQLRQQGQRPDRALVKRWFMYAKAALRWTCA
jgi:hypothetical protein